VGVLVGIALVMTFGVYGLVAAIVKLDDAGLALSRQPLAAAQALGRGILAAAPYLMRTLSVVGTAAMFLVGGGILLQGLPGGHQVVHAATLALQGLPAVGGLLAALAPLLLDALAGIVAGALVLGLVTGVRALR